METLTSYRDLVETLRGQIQAQAEALAYIANALAQEAEQRQRADQADCIDVVRQQLLLEVRRLEQAEASACSDFSMARPGMSLAKAVGTGLGAWLTRNGDPLRRGLEVLKREIAKTAPFGNVVIELGPEGVPERIKAISVSKLSREADAPESETIKGLEAKGYRLVKPESFFTALDELKQKVLGGVVVLPITSEQVRACLAASAPKAEKAGLPAPAIITPVLRPRLLPDGWPTTRTINGSGFPS